MLYLRNCKEFEAEILNLQIEKYGLSFDIKKVLLPVKPWGMRMWSVFSPLNQIFESVSDLFAKEKISERIWPLPI